MKTKVLVILSLLILSKSTFAYQGEIDNFFKLYESGKSLEAVDSIYSTNKWISQKSDDVHNVKTQLQNLQSLVGKYQGKVLLGEEDIADRLTHVTYLALFERQPVRLEFVFYRPQEEWIIYSFSFDDDIDDELESVSRRKIAGY